MFSVTFIRDIVQNRIICSELLGLLNFYFPQRKLREKFHFRIPTYKSNYAYINTIIRCMDITNKVINDVDIFANVSLFTFKYKLVIALDQLTRR